MRKYQGGGGVSSGVRRLAMSNKTGRGSGAETEAAAKKPKTKTRKPRGTGIATRGTSFRYQD